jgi:ribosomal protein S18 acetylase RimI-like enzyme
MTTSSMPLLRPYRMSDRDAVVVLWRDCGLLRPWNDPDRDIERKLGQDPDGFLVLDVRGQVVGSVMAGYDGHRGWVNYLAVDPARREEGLGSMLMAAAERRLEMLGCPKVNLQVRAGNQQIIDFYRRLGYTVDEVVSMGKRLSDDTVPQEGESRLG